MSTPVKQSGEGSATRTPGELDEAGILKLVKKCASGDEESLQHFFELFSQDIYNFPLKIFHLDQDSASEFYLYAYDRLANGKRFKSFQGKSSFKTWFYSVLRNMVIDWMRTVKVLPTVNINKYDQNGREFRTIENEADPTSTPQGHLEMDQVLGTFYGTFQKLKVETRIIFKLSYLFYLTLDQEEIDFLCQKRGWSQEELQSRLLELRTVLTEKNSTVIKSEDKLTSLYQKIQELKLKKQKILTGVSDNRALTTEENYTLEKIDQSLDKKYRQREKLIDKNEKGAFIVRTPYKYISEILDIPEGSLSVQLMRAIEKMKTLME